MNSGRAGDLIVARLNEGEDVLASIEAVAEREGAQTAIVVSGIGMIRGARLGYWDGGSYRIAEVEGPVELLSLHGSCIPGSVHLHAVVGMEDHSTLGGHLLGGTVRYVNEVTMLAASGLELAREEDRATGMRLLTVRPGK